MAPWVSAGCSRTLVWQQQSCERECGWPADRLADQRRPYFDGTMGERLPGILSVQIPGGWLGISAHAFKLPCIRISWPAGHDCVAASPASARLLRDSHSVPAPTFHLCRR